ncbi:alpha/beta hydrolase [Microbacterium sp. zg.B48]|uniref:alpha/beta fold hydrolase n=1 Tax=Microbacterium sp. zg.B48 TaxID=2969408 RepID=UPI00214C5020|nr:alpha/beta hydrolase [Microbacterium sp. zg.B48]MCR2764271.1 alpha/beta hydrolase [Microbacterium sp. zg.B48]
MTDVDQSRRPVRFLATLATASVVVLILAACSDAAPPPASPRPSGGDIVSTESVDIGGGRTMILECAGTGSPTVVFISGTRGAADEWDTLLADADPAAVSTFDDVSRTTRACSYDRPGTTRASGELSPSTVVAQPTTARQGAEDLLTMMDAAGEPGPYVVVALSWGGLIAQELARTHPSDVAGLVLLDSASAYLAQTFSADQWARWMAVITASADSLGSEVPAYEMSISELQADAALPTVPVVVISSDHPWDLQLTPGESTWPGWVAAQAELARSLGAVHITDSDSGHGIPVEQPALVTAAIRVVLDTVRDVRTIR